MYVCVCMYVCTMMVEDDTYIHNIPLPAFSCFCQPAAKSNLAKENSSILKISQNLPYLYAKGMMNVGVLGEEKGHTHS